MISNQSLEILMDLIEIQLGSVRVHAQDDARYLNRLRHCRHELAYLYDIENGKHASRNFVRTFHTPTQAFLQDNVEALKHGYQVAEDRSQSPSDPSVA